MRFASFARGEEGKEARLQDMGNKGSTDSAPSLTPVQQREVRAACDLASCIPALLFIFYQENLYEDYVTPALSSVSGGRAPGPAATGGSGTPPILTRPHTEHRRPQQGLERRSMTVVGRGDIVRLYAEKKNPPNLGHHSGHYYIGVYSYLRIRDRLNIANVSKVSLIQRFSLKQLSRAFVFPLAQAAKE